jgi:tetratricopeptide (TPR) repeat protein
MIKPENERHVSARDRARVAAELLEEARFLTDTGETAIPTPLGTANGNGNGNGKSNGHQQNGNGNRHGHPGSRSSQSDADRLLAQLDGSVAAQPESVQLLVDRAKQLGAMGRYSAARADLERALLLDPANLAVRTALGIVLLRKGLWGDAVPHLREVVAEESWSPTAWFYLGEALNHVDDLDGALAAFVRAAELDPRHAKALHAQGMVLDRLHRPEEAALLYRRSREAAAR